MQHHTYRRAATIAALVCLNVLLGLGAGAGAAAAAASLPVPGAHVVALRSGYARFLGSERRAPEAITYSRGHQVAASSVAFACTEPKCPLLYGGGAVQSSPRVYLLLWGPAWSTAGADARYLANFYAGLGQQPDDGWSTTMEQYGVAAGYPSFHGSVLAGVYQDTSTPPYGVSQDQLAAEADAFYSAQGLNDPANTQIVIATQSGTCPQGFYDPVCDPSGSYCAWHSVSSVHQVPYTNLPYQPDAGAGCGEDAVNATGTYDGFSIVGGHEFAETVTDPFPTSGWWDGGDASGGEIGDKCAWKMLFDLTLPTGAFAMQPLYSNLTNSCVRSTQVFTPSMPPQPTAVAGTPGEATVTFSAPAIDGNAPIQSYQVTVRDVNTATEVDVSASGSPFTATGLTPGDTYEFLVAAVNAAGVGTESAPSNTVLIAGTPPAAPGGIQAAFVTGSRLSSGTAPTVPRRVSWTQGSCAAGATYTLTESVDGGVATAVYQGTALTRTLSLAPGGLYEFSVACGGRAVSTTFRLNAYQQTAATFSGIWTTVQLSSAWGGSAAVTTSAGAAATFTCTCGSVAWVTDEGAADGSAKVYVDGVLKATVSTHATTSRYRVVLFQHTFGSVAAHTIKIVGLATTGHPGVSVDGFLTTSTS
jgi:serine protease